MGLMTPHISVKRCIHSVLVLTLGLCLACRQEEPPDPLAVFQENGELIILTRNAPTTYYEGRDGEWEGFEHDLAVAFAEYLDVKPVFKVMDSTAEILHAIETGEGHIAAAGLTRTPEREERFLFGPDYLAVFQEVVCGRAKALPRELWRLQDRGLVIIGDSSYHERLAELQQFWPRLTWTSAFNEETEQIMDSVWHGEVDCTVADSNIVEINRRYYPELRVAMRLSDSQPLAWVVARDHDFLLPILYAWYAEMQSEWFVEDLKERYFGHVDLFDYVDVKRFYKRVDERLPEYEAYFKAAGERFGLSWTLLAAQAYQESHWDVDARSPTGVRGLTMLTLRTAEQMGVVDRLDPEQSIHGGARYLLRLMERLPRAIEQPDRTWFALACYNVGYGHVMDARILALRQGLNPNVWRDLQQTLPLLSKPKHYKTLPHGYARGQEPVRYVQRIRDFKDMLEQRLNNESMQVLSN